MNNVDTLDKVDLQILRTLQENARQTTKELAAKVSLSSTPVFERLKRLEAEGHIKKYIAVLDAEKLNLGFILNVLGMIDTLASLEGVFVMDVIKHDYGIHI